VSVIRRGAGIKVSLERPFYLIFNFAFLLISGTLSQGTPFSPRLISSNDTDFDFDGNPDILMHHSAWGANAILRMNGINPQGWTSLPVYSGWTPVASGDFNRDGSPDILMHHSAWGANAILTMNGINPQGWTSLPFYSGWTPV
jgi:hypothetical protein